MELPSDPGPSYGIRRPYTHQTSVTTQEGDTTVHWDRERYNNRRTRPVNRHPLKNKWTSQGYNKTDSYSRVNTVRPTQAETSFTEPVRTVEETNLSTLGEGIRQRRPIQQQNTSDRPGNQVRRPTSSGRRGIPYERIPERPTETRIDIGNLPNSEHLPLLPTAGNSALAGSATSLATGAAGIGIAAGVGYGVNRLVNSIRQDGAVLPGTEYVGPGNPIRIGPARHETDQIARDHDLQYEEVIARARKNHWSEQQFAREIDRLDKEARDRFWRVYSTQGSWQSLVGSLGLGIKNKVEQHTGVIYPSFSGKNEI